MAPLQDAVEYVSLVRVHCVPGVGEPLRRLGVDLIEGFKHGRDALAVGPVDGRRIVGCQPELLGLTLNLRLELGLAAGYGFWVVVLGLVVQVLIELVVELEVLALGGLSIGGTPAEHVRLGLVAQPIGLRLDLARLLASEHRPLLLLGFLLALRSVGVLSRLGRLSRLSRLGRLGGLRGLVDLPNRQ